MALDARFLLFALALVGASACSGSAIGPNSDGGDTRDDADAGEGGDGGASDTKDAGSDGGGVEGDGGRRGDGGALDGGIAKRNPLKWPFAKTSIWNMPIGSGARYVPAQIPEATEYGMTVDEELIVMTPAAPATQVFTNLADWSQRDRCPIEGPLLFTVPIPSDFLWGDQRPGTPNSCFAGLLSDGKTVVQTQPFTRCTAAARATSHYVFPNTDLFSDGIIGAHGGSRLSAIGGSLRVGELLPGSPPIRHALKVNLNARRALWNCTVRADCHRWPAPVADNGAENFYGGSVPALKMGALLAIPASVPIATLQLETEPARRLAWTLQNYGAYVVDDTAWDVYALNIEVGPAGDVRREFRSAWGFSLSMKSRQEPWSRDMVRLFSALHVVDNNGPQSIGGGGTPLQPLAPDF